MGHPGGAGSEQPERTMFFSGMRPLYLLRCADATLYCGVTTDMERRLREHNAGSRGAKYTRARRPVELVCCVAQPDASSACRLEREVKQRPRAEKAAFLLARAERPPEEE